MQPTPRLRVLYDKIPQVLVFVYVCRGLLGNMEELPTHQVYIDILTCVAIFYHLEDSRSHGNKREAEQARGQGPALPPWVPALLQEPIRLCLMDYAPPPLRIKENHEIKVGLIQRPTLI